MINRRRKAGGSVAWKADIGDYMTAINSSKYSAAKGKIGGTYDPDQPRWFNMFENMGYTASPVEEQVRALRASGGATTQEWLKNKSLETIMRGQGFINPVLENEKLKKSGGKDEPVEQGASAGGVTVNLANVVINVKDLTGGVGELMNLLKTAADKAFKDGGSEGGGEVPAGAAANLVGQGS
jgi:hypothetical protein